VVNPWIDTGPMLRLSRNPHPRDKRAWLPISSPHNLMIKQNLLLLMQI